MVCPPRSQVVILVPGLNPSESRCLGRDALGSRIAPALARATPDFPDVDRSAGLRQRELGTGDNDRALG